MPSDTSEHVPAMVQDDPGPAIADAAGRPQSDARHPAAASSTTTIVVAHEPVTEFAPAVRPHDEVLVALVRLREALVSTGHSLDRVAAAIPCAGAETGVARSPAP